MPTLSADSYARLRAGVANDAAAVEIDAALGAGSAGFAADTKLRLIDALGPGGQAPADELESKVGLHGQTLTDATVRALEVGLASGTAATEIKAKVLAL